MVVHFMRWQAQSLGGRRSSGCVHLQGSNEGHNRVSPPSPPPEDGPARAMVAIVSSKEDLRFEDVIESFRRRGTTCPLRSMFHNG